MTEPLDPQKIERNEYRLNVSRICLALSFFPSLIFCGLLFRKMGMGAYHGMEFSFFCGLALCVIFSAIATQSLMRIRYGAVAAKDFSEAANKARSDYRQKVGDRAYEGIHYYRSISRRYTLIFALVIMPFGAGIPLFLGETEMSSYLKEVGSALVLCVMLGLLLAVISTERKFPGTMKKIRQSSRSS